MARGEVTFLLALLIPSNMNFSAVHKVTSLISQALAHHFVIYPQEVLRRMILFQNIQS